ncbi:perlucin-like [Sitophilus oryzae]|uniref:Perlucin-like n=1 Tax=Sitophilus oryzae TaxID=7048 RepID=A0A6J2XAH5_SITOR|nr:perlucin-like [Sitophilus oryzae]
MTSGFKSNTVAGFLVLALCQNVYGSHISSRDSDDDYNSEDIGKMYYVSPDKGNFFQALLFCTSAGMELATVENESETAVLNKTLEHEDKLKEGWKNGYWLSGSSLAYPETLEFYWTSTGQKMIYTNWAKSEPDNAKKEQFCVAAALIKNKIVWGDNECKNVMKYICQTKRSCCNN